MVDHNPNTRVSDATAALLSPLNFLKAIKTLCSVMLYQETSSKSGLLHTFYLFTSI